MTLLEQFETHEGRSVHKPLHYLSIYEQHFLQFRHRPVTLLEIGVAGGGSLQLWKQHFGCDARIIGIDSNPECKQVEEEQIHVRIGRQEDTAFLRNVLDEFGSPDIVIDDGGHRGQDVCATFRFLYPAVSPLGLYAVEDLSTSYWPEYGGALGHPDSFIEHIKSLIDELHAFGTRGLVRPTDFTSSTEAIHVYEHLTIFEKHPYETRIAAIRGPSKP